MHRRLAEVSGERDAARLASQRLRRTVDFYRQRLLPLTTGRPSASEAVERAQRVRELLQGLEADGRSVAASASAADLVPADYTSTARAPGSPRTYEALRLSLDEAVQRCEGLNSDMARQAEANEELVDQLGTVKDSNKRLLEQIRAQTEEIAQLTQQRINDEERLNHFSLRHQADHESLRQETCRRILAVRDAAGDEYNSTHRQLTDRLRFLRSRCEVAEQDRSRLREESQRLRIDVTSIRDSMLRHLRLYEQDISKQCQSIIDMHAKRKDAVNEAIAQLEKELQTEREQRLNGSLSWHHQLAMLDADKEDVQACIARDQSHLNSQLQALERMLKTEKESWERDRARHQEQINDKRRQKTEKQLDVEKLQRDIVRFETQCDSAESEIRTKEQVVAELRRQIREADDALAWAVSSNEHLREQMEEQRRRFQQKNEAELADYQATFEQKLTDVRSAKETDISLATKQLQMMEDEVRDHEEALHSLKAQAVGVSSEFESLGHDVTSWTEQHDGAKTSLEHLEKQLFDTKQGFATDRLKLQASIEWLSTCILEIEDSSRRTLEQLERCRREMSTSETQRVTQLDAAEGQLKDMQDQLVELRRRLLEATEARQRTSEEAAAWRMRVAEMQVSLETSIQTKQQNIRDEVHRLSDVLSAEKRAADLAKEQLDREVSSSTAAIQRAKEESQSRLGVVQMERSRVEDIAHGNREAASEAVAQQARRVDALEYDLSRLRQMLSESESNHAWVRQELEHEDRETSTGELRQLGDEMRGMGMSLEKLLREDADLSQQIEAAQKRQEQEKVRLEKELEAVQQSGALQHMESEARLQRTRSELEKEASSRLDRARTSAEADRLQEEALQQENRQLRSFLGDQERITAAVSRSDFVYPRSPGGSPVRLGVAISPLGKASPLRGEASVTAWRS
eukprot:gnl/TRDRNA2_/TRDRNA2_35056_c0_seq1.p1 gnl/TRDRNA2_/TRDRNA2_35056_c0~~gnl/TRDRNA2_/TRDRNA2_35056_c0_seq1.p1  ORF type:complete len:917 (+),score=228.40 gnl/TRDRNA2_/TRDRNA2_35056_c0_seq1:66-2816(+)